MENIFIAEEDGERVEKTRSFFGNDLICSAGSIEPRTGWGKYHDGLIYRKQIADVTPNSE